MGEMQIHTATDWNQVHWTETEAWVHADDLAWLKELVQNIKHCKDADQIRAAEMEFHHDIAERYTRNIASALLLKVWKMTENNDEDLW